MEVIDMPKGHCKVCGNAPNSFAHRKACMEKREESKPEEPKQEGEQCTQPVTDAENPQESVAASSE